MVIEFLHITEILTLCMYLILLIIHNCLAINYPIITAITHATAITAIIIIILVTVIIPEIIMQDITHTITGTLLFPITQHQIIAVICTQVLVMDITTLVLRTILVPITLVVPAKIYHIPQKILTTFQPIPHMGIMVITIIMVAIIIIRQGARDPIQEQETLIHLAIIPVHIRTPQPQ